MKHIKYFNYLNENKKTKDSLVLNLLDLNKEQLNFLEKQKEIQKMLDECDMILDEKTIKRYPYLYYDSYDEDMSEFGTCKKGFLRFIPNYKMSDFDKFVQTYF